MQILNNILDSLGNVPVFTVELIKTMMIPCIITLVVYLIVLIFSGKFPYALRAVYIIASLLFMGYGYIMHEYELIWIFGSSLVLLIIVRAIISIVRTVNENRRIAQIERKALAKSAKRRGTWENKKGYSGEERPIVAEEYKPEVMTEEEIEDVIENHSAK